MDKSPDSDWRQYLPTDESNNSNHMNTAPMVSSMNVPVQQTPIGKALDNDGRQYQTMDKSKKKLLICTNYINIKKNICDI